MTQNRTAIRIDRLFDVKSGDYHATYELDPGDTPLISCGTTDNGFVGFFDIPPEKTYRRAITVAYNGLPLTTKFHPYRFGAKDDVAVLRPLEPMQDATLLYVASQLNMLVWRYSYGRKCYRQKLQNVRVLVPLVSSNGAVQIDEQATAALLPKPVDAYIPKMASADAGGIPPLVWARFTMLEVFDLSRGDFHALDDLDPGTCMTVSRVTTDNGVVGYFDRPNRARMYERGVITVSTVGGDAFVQLDDFIATDNVIMCVPKEPLRPTTLYFAAFMLNQQKWRYSYGRQCYREKLSHATIELPVCANGDFDEDAMEMIVGRARLWPHIERRFH